MSHERLSIERATWAVAIRTRLQDEFSLREYLNDHATIFVVKSDAVPDWSAKLAVCSAHGVRNQVELDGKVISYSFSMRMRDKLIGLLREHQQRYVSTMTEAKRNELAQEQWAAREQTELKGLPELGTVSTTIIRNGPYAGQYTVSFYPGHPLEHLTLEQVKAFHAFAGSLGSTKA